MEGTAALYQEKAELLKALSHPIRLQIVRGLLKNGCHNVGCMEVSLGQSQSCISQHLARLKGAGVVKASRSGNEVYYDVENRERVAALVATLFEEREEDYARDV